MRPSPAFAVGPLSIYLSIYLARRHFTGWRGVNGRWDYEETRVAWCGHVDSVLSRRDILRLPSAQLSALYAARLVLILGLHSIVDPEGSKKNSRACPAAVGLHARGTMFPGSISVRLTLW